MKDTLYLLEGFDEFSSTGQLSGVSVLSDSLLELKFKKPFRLAIDHLTGIRFAITKKAGSEFIGTGPYVISSKSETKLELTSNPFFDKEINFNKIEIYYIPYPQDIDSISKNKIDVSMGNLFYNIPECNDDNLNLECLYGQETSHLVLPLNGIKNRIFEDSKLRNAIQYLITSELKKTDLWKSFFVQGFTPDNQVFLPLQSGRLKIENENEIIQKGPEHLEFLRKQSKKHPITFFSTSPCTLITDILKRNGVNVTELNNGQNGLSGINIYNKTYDTDMMIMTLSIAHGDPDGIYHALGKTGAIASKMTMRDSVTNLLEEGRSIIDITKLDQHYQKVNEAILREVPFIHLGFTRKLYIYNKNRIKVNDVILHRRGIDFNVFEKI